MTFDTLTVLLTAYNPGPYLGQAIDALLAQTYANFELLIVDDASTDGAVAEIGAIKDARIRIVRNAANMGQTASLNAGLRLARGQWIARMDADDLALPQWLARQTQFLSAQKLSTAVVSTRAGVINEHNRLQRILNTPLTQDEIRLKSLWASPINHVGSLLNREAVLAVGGYDEGYKIAADFDLWTRLMAKGYQLAVSPQVSVLVRLHEKSLSATNRLGREVTEVKNIVGRRVADESKRLLTDEELDLWVKGHYQPETIDGSQFQRLLGLADEVIDACPNIGPLAKQKHLQRLRRLLKGKRLMSGSQKTVANLYRLWGRASARAALRESIPDMKELGVMV